MRFDPIGANPSNLPLPIQLQGRRTMSLSEQIAQQVSENIVQGKLAAGQAITEHSLSASFGVSRGPVREALRILEKEGLVEIVPRHGARVTRLTLEEVNQVFELRAVLLGYSAARAAENRTDLCLKTLRGGIEILSRNVCGDDSLPVHMRASGSMNEALVRESGNLRIIQLVYHLARQTVRYSRLGLSTPESRRHSVATWQSLIDHIAAGRAPEAEALERERVLDVRRFAANLIEAETATAPEKSR